MQSDELRRNSAQSLNIYKPTLMTFADFISESSRLIGTNIGRYLKKKVQGLNKKQF